MYNHNGPIVALVGKLVNFSLISNPYGYRLGAVNTVGVTIGSPLSQGMNNLAERQGVAISEVGDVPTVRISAGPSVVLEGGKVTVEIISDPAPQEDIEVNITFSGDVIEGKDFEVNESKFLIPAGVFISTKSFLFFPIKPFPIGD